MKIYLKDNLLEKVIEKDRYLRDITHL